MKLDQINFLYFKKECSIQLEPLKGQCFSILFTYNESSLYFFITSEQNDESETIDNVKQLKVVYNDRAYSIGKIPKNRMRREIFTTDSDILISRLVDRSLRTQMPYMKTKIELNILLVNSDKNDDISVAAVLGANIAMKLFIGEEFNFNIPVKLTMSNKDLVINEKVKEIDQIFSLMFTINTIGIDMIELCSKRTIDKNIAIKYLEKIYEQAKLELEKISNSINCLEFQRLPTNSIIKFNTEELHIEQTEEIISQRLNNNFKSNSKLLSELKALVTEKLVKNLNIDSSIKTLYTCSLINEAFAKIYLKSKRRIDGRGFEDLRKIEFSINMFKEPHSCVLFSRGKTQVLTTMVASDDDDKIQEENGPSRSIYAHYTFYSFSCDEMSKGQGIKRRELGHGYIIEHSLNSVINKQQLSYNALRTSVDILSSDGSTSLAGSMSAAICAKALGLENSKLLVGVGYGAIVGKDKEIHLLSDINGAEDEFGIFDTKILFDENKNLSYIHMDSKKSLMNPTLFQKVLNKAFIQCEEYLISIKENPELKDKFFPLHKAVNRYYVIKIAEDKQRSLFPKQVLMKIETKHKVRIDTKRERIIVIGRDESVKEVVELIQTQIKQERPK